MCLCMCNGVYSNQFKVIHVLVVCGEIVHNRLESLGVIHREAGPDLTAE